MGLLWASQLAHSHSVTLINKMPQPNRQLAFSVQQEDQLTQARITSLTVAEVSAPISHLLVCTKSYDAARAVTEIHPKLDPTANILLLQNGLGSQAEVSQQLLEAGLGEAHVYALSTTEAANKSSATRVIYAGKGCSWLGPYNDPARQNNRAKSLAQSLALSGLTVLDEEQIQHRLWRKLIINCGINPFTVLFNCRNGDILDKPLFIDHIDALAMELELISRHAGNHIQWQQIKADIIDVASKTKANISSTLQDVRAGRPTEMNYLNGYISRYAETHGLSAPVNRMLCNWLDESHFQSKPDQPDR